MDIKVTTLFFKITTYSIKSSFGEHLNNRTGFLPPTILPSPFAVIGPQSPHPNPLQTLRQNRDVKESFAKYWQSKSLRLTLRHISLVLSCDMEGRGVCGKRREREREGAKVFLRPRSLQTFTPECWFFLLKLPSFSNAI